MIKKLYYPAFADVTPCRIELAGEINEDGELVPVDVWEGKVNFSQTARRVQDKEGMWAPLSGIVRVGKDIFPGKLSYTGYVTIDNVKMSIVSVSKPRNPDGTVNHTKLELM